MCLPCSFHAVCRATLASAGRSAHTLKSALAAFSGWYHDVMATYTLQHNRAHPWCLTPICAALQGWSHSAWWCQGPCDVAAAEQA